MNACGINSLSSAGLGLLVAATLGAPSSFGEDRDSDARHLEPACLLIEPVICRSSEGTDPAASRIDRKAIEAVYAQATIRIAWLQPRYLDDTAARDGISSWKQVSELGQKRGLWGSGPTRLSLVFANAKGNQPHGLGAIDFRPGRPYGAGGPICIVYLPKKQWKPTMESYCIAHETGHCLGLKHADKDPLHPRDIPSIMNGGGGKFSYADRIGKTALVPSQIDVVRKSRLLWWPKLDPSAVKEGQQQARDGGKQEKDRKLDRGYDPFAGLDLTDEQLDKIKAIKGKSNKAKAKLWKEAKRGAVDRKKFDEIKEGITKDFQASLKEVLSEAQYAEYRKNWEAFMEAHTQGRRQ